MFVPIRSWWVGYIAGQIVTLDGSEELVFRQRRGVEMVDVITMTEEGNNRIRNGDSNENN